MSVRPLRGGVAAVLLGLALLLPARAALPAAASADPFAPSDVPSGTLTMVGPNLRVNAFARSGSTLYLGGAFTGVGYRAPNLVPVDAATGATHGLSAQLDPLNAGAAVAISAVAAAPDGGAYVAGPIAGADGVAQPRLLRLTAEGQIDTSFRPQLDVGSATDANKNVTALALGPASAAHPAGILYMSGPFRSVGGTAAGTLAAVDAQTGDRVATWAPPSVNGTVTKLVVGTRAVYAAGTFTTLANGVARRGLAAFALTDGSGTAWDPQVSGTTIPGTSTPLVVDLAVAGDVVYLGGQFTSVRGADDAPAARRYLAAVAATGTGGLLPSWDPRADKPVTALAVTPAAVYVGGVFAHLGNDGANRTRIGAVEPASGGGAGRALAWAPQVSPDPPQAIAISGDTAYVGLRSNYYDPANPGVYDGTSVAPSRVDGQLRCGVAALDADPAQAGALRAGWDAGLASTAGACTSPALVGLPTISVTGLAVAGDRVWMQGGSQVWTGSNGVLGTGSSAGFAASGEQDRQHLAAIDLSTDTLLPWAPRLGDPNRTADMARALAVSPDGATVYVGGTFAAVAAGGRSTPRANAAAFSSAGAGATLDWNPAPNNTVRALALSPAGDRVYLGGTFDQVGGQAHSRIARVLATGTGAPTAWYAFTTSGTVYDVAVSLDGNTVFTGGTFTRAGGVNLNGVAALNGTTGQAVAGWDAGLRPDANNATAVYSLAYTLVGPGPTPTPRLYLGGAFGPSPAAAVDPATGARVTAWAPAITSRGSAVSVSRVNADPSDGTAYLSGQFAAIGGQSRNGVASVGADGTLTGWDPARGTTSSLQEPSDPRPAGALLLPPAGGDPAGPSRVVLGGSFTTLSGHPRPAFALFASAAPPTPATPPTIAGSATPGATLTCAAGTFGGSPGTSTYTWLGGADGATVVATGATYVVGGGDLGSALRCRQTVTNAGGAATQTSLPRTVALLAPASDVAPSVDGDPWPGGTASCTTGLWRNGPESYTYRWLLDGVVLDGATGTTHDVGVAEQGHALQCEVTATNAGGASAPALSAPVVVTEAPPSSGGGPRITGDARVGGTLTCDPGSWSGARSFAYAWLRDGAELAGETAQTHAATSRDLGHALRCLVTVANQGGQVTVESDAVVVTPSPHSAAYERPAANGAGAVGGAGTAARRVDLRGVTWTGGTTITATIAAPAAGRTIVAVAPKGGGRALVRKSATARKHATLVVRIALGAAARAKIARAGAKGLKVTVTVTFTPKARGAAQHDRLTLTLHRVAAPKKHR